MFALRYSHSTCVRLTTQSFRFCASQEYPYGLYDKTDTQFYRTNLDLVHAGNILDDSDLFWNAAKADVTQRNVAEEALGAEIMDYLTSVQSRSEAFLNSGVLEDREEVLSNLSSLMLRQKGKFVLYLGGKSTGKSTTLQDIVRRTTDTKDPLFRLPVSYIDGRKSEDLAELLLDILPPDFVEGFLVKRFPDLDLGKYWKAGKTNAAVVLSLIPVVGDKLKNAVPQTRPKPREILEAFIAECKSKPDRKIPVIIIDEANRFLEDALRDPVKHQELKSVLELFATNTKQRHDLHVILAASEHAFPYLLNQIGGGNFSANFTDFIFAGEIPPGSMYNLLTKQWGMGENLAVAFLNCYGGHVWLCSLAVDALIRRKQRFRAVAVLGSAISNAIRSCLDSNDKPGMEELFIGVAKDGYFPLKTKDDFRNAIDTSVVNITGTVDAQAHVVGVPLDVREKSGSLSGAIPASQVARLLLARELYPPNAQTE